MTKFYHEQVVLISGASRGIGKAIAQAFAAQGAYVLGTATTTSAANTITQVLTAHHDRGAGLVLDLNCAASVTKFTEALADFPAPTILVNNAGVTRDNLLMRMQAAEWETVINTNLNAVYKLSKLCLRAMLKARFGRIINISSVVGLTGNSGQTNYAATKAGIIGFTRALAKEVGSRGVTVNAIAPGFIETDMTKQLPAQVTEQLLKQIALARFGRPEEIATAALFLASEAASYITGQTINVNGGLYMG